MEVDLLHLNQALVHHLNSSSSEVLHQTTLFLLLVQIMLTCHSISRHHCSKMLLLVLHQIHLATLFPQERLLLFKKQLHSVETSKLNLKVVAEQ